MEMESEISSSVDACVRTFMNGKWKASRQVGIYIYVWFFVEFERERDLDESALFLA